MCFFAKRSPPLPLVMFSPIVSLTKILHSGKQDKVWKGTNALTLNYNSISKLIVYSSFPKFSYKWVCFMKIINLKHFDTIVNTFIRLIGNVSFSLWLELWTPPFLIYCKSKRSDFNYSTIIYFTFDSIWFRSYFRSHLSGLRDQNQRCSSEEMTYGLKIGDFP